MHNIVLCVLSCIVYAELAGLKADAKWLVCAMSYTKCSEKGLTVFTTLGLLKQTYVSNTLLDGQQRQRSFSPSVVFSWRH